MTGALIGLGLAAAIIALFVGIFGLAKDLRRKFGWEEFATSMAIFLLIFLAAIGWAVDYGLVPTGAAHIKTLGGD